MPKETIPPKQKKQLRPYNRRNPPSSKTNNYFYPLITKQPLTSKTSKTMNMLTDKQLQRYNRQLILEDFGPSAQRKLLNSKVLVIGAGGLGSPALLYLASAGVGTIGIAEFDTVDISNLQRQILYEEQNIGSPKNISASNRLRNLNSDVEIVVHDLKVGCENILQTIEGYSFVIDATDTTGKKLMINDACVLSKIPLSHGGVLQLSGQNMTVLPGQSCCLRCAFPSLEPQAEQSCSQAGILGAVAGIIGSIQALEAVKQITGTGVCLVDAVQFFDAETMRFQKVRIKKSPECPVCGKKTDYKVPLIIKLSSIVIVNTQKIEVKIVNTLFDM
ncbi:Sulfur carrier protein adenylyltransferase ThiF [Chitinispirillum alkaliphilum]|nr:Sulfur carrier protein adenylyltransferase ThiF [Chitinispirillum alkaliphilum]